MDSYVSVSIPFWVSTVLRLVGHGSGTSFSSTVSIPFWVSTVLRPPIRTRTRRSKRRFQSRSGFLLSCDSNAVSDTLTASMFQSRSGFLLSCDQSHPAGRQRTDRVSIPFWVSTVLRQTSRRSTTTSTACFNPVLGFYCPATPPGRSRQRRGQRVSIPFWVSTVLRPGGTTRAAGGGIVSIPFWVSTVLRPRRSRRRLSRDICFNPVLGFYCPATPEARDLVHEPAFQSRSGFLLSCDS